MKIVVTGNGPECGKSTAAKIFSILLRKPYASSSDAVIEFSCDVREIMEIKNNKYVYRDKLITRGNYMRSMGISPTLIKFKEGYSIVDGARNVWEIERAKEEYDVIHIHIIKEDIVGKDNTDSKGLLENANYVIINDKEISNLVKKCQNIIYSEYRK